MNISTHHLSPLILALLLFSGCGRWGEDSSAEDQGEVDRYRASPSDEATARLARSSFEDSMLLEQRDGMNVLRAWRVLVEVRETSFQVYAALPCEPNSLFFCSFSDEKEPLLELEIVEHGDPPNLPEDWCHNSEGFRGPCATNRPWYMRDWIVLSKRPEAVRQNKLLAPCQESLSESEVVSLAANRAEGGNEVEDITFELQYLCEGDATRIQQTVVLSPR